MIHNRFPLQKTKKIGFSAAFLGVKEGAHKSHNIAELPSGFLVSSTPSSTATGRSVIEPTPIMPKWAKSTPVLCGFTINADGLNELSKR
jgi:hypothetical protein